MNIYKIISVSYGNTQATFVSSSDIVSAIYSSGVNQSDIIRIELIDSRNVVSLVPDSF